MMTMHYLITQWFGTFLHDGKKVVKTILFPKDEKEVAERLLMIKKGKILEEEKELVKGWKDVVTNDVRLSKIAEYHPNVSLFKTVEIKPETYGFNLGLLQKASVKVAESETMEYLEKKDLQVIQMIKSFDDLVSFSNNLSERLNEWNSLPSPDDSIIVISELKKQVEHTIDSLEEAILQRMQKVAPNLATVAGPLLGARLIMLAGGLDRLARMPASTIQIIGAERALFRYKHGEGTPPKHGVIFQHHLMRKVKPSQRGKVARLVAAKCATAAKADVFTKRDLSAELKKDITKRLREIQHV